MNRIRRIVYFAVMALMSAGVGAAPIIFYSDLTSAPSSGWSEEEPSQGAAVTIWGKNFGSTRGGSFVTVNGVNILADSSYPEKWGEKKPTPHLQKIVFFLNDKVPLGGGSISVTVNGEKSNSVPFHVNSSSIYFAKSGGSSVGDGTISSPWSNVYSFLAVAQPGDLLYLREGMFTEKIHGGQETFYIRNGAHGTKSKPIGIVGYPGEVAIVDALETMSSTKRTAIRVKNDWYTFSKLTLRADQSAIIADGVGSRVVGNDAVGVVSGLYGTGTIVTKKDSIRVFGNSVHGGRSNNRLDHGIYVSGCAPSEGVEVAYNHLFDNAVDEGPIIVVNHQDNRCSSDVYVKSHYVHSNYVDCTGARSRAIGIYDLSWDGGSETEPQPTYVYNNISVSCGIDRWWTALYQNAAHVEWYNNLVYDSNGVGLEIGGDRVLSSIVKNNIFHLSKDWEYVRLLGVSAEVFNNAYWGSTGNLTNPESLDSKALIQDPEIIPDLQGASLSLGEVLLGAGTNDSDVRRVVSTDYHGNARPSSSLSIGPIELDVVASLPPVLLSSPLPPSDFTATIE